MVRWADVEVDVPPAWRSKSVSETVLTECKPANTCIIRKCSRHRLTLLAKAYLIRWTGEAGDGVDLVTLCGKRDPGPWVRAYGVAS
jgi:hypothetical protein